MVFSVFFAHLLSNDCFIQSSFPNLHWMLSRTDEDFIIIFSRAMCRNVVKFNTIQNSYITGTKEDAMPPGTS